MNLKYKSISIVIATSLLLYNLNYLKPFSNSLNYSFNTIDINNFNTENFSEETVYMFEECLNLLSDYKNNKDIETLKKCITTFCNIPESIVIGGADFSLERDGIFDYIFYSIRDLVYTIEDLNTQTDLTIFLGENLFKGWRKNKNIEDYSLIYLIDGLVEFNENKNNNAQNRLDYLKNLYFYFKNNEDKNPFEDNIPDINTEGKPDFNEPIIPPSANIGATIKPNHPDINNNNSNSESNGNLNTNLSGDIFTELEEYIKKDNKCVKVIHSYKNGQLVSSLEEPVNLSNYIKCGIDSYLHNDISNNNIAIDKNHIENNQNEDSPYYIYYTINKNSKNPYYFNTGIRASSIDKKVSYNQLKDVFYQIAIKSNGHTISDNEKFLAIIEGVPTVLKNDKDSYSTLEIEEISNKFKSINIKISENIENKSQELESILLEQEIDTFTIDNKEVILSTPFKVVENQLIAPIEEIANYLDIKTSLKNNKLTLYKENTTVDLYLNSKKYYVNSVEKLFFTNSTIIDSNIYCEVGTVLSLFEYKIIWDDDNSKINISKK